VEQRPQRTAETEREGGPRKERGKTGGEGRLRPHLKKQPGTNSLLPSLIEKEAVIVSQGWELLCPDPLDCEKMSQTVFGGRFLLWS